jgi:hypothetical protein
MDILDGFQKLVSTQRTISISISIGLDCRDPQELFEIISSSDNYQNARLTELWN